LSFEEWQKVTVKEKDLNTIEAYFRMNKAECNISLLKTIKDG